MVERSCFVVALVAGSCVSVAWGGPHDQKTKATGTAVRVPFSAPAQDGPGFSDNFDSYAAGSGIAGQGGWQLWDAAAQNATADPAIAFSAPNSAVAVNNTDIVQLFDITSGEWVMEAQTYMPSTASGTGYFIVLNTFALPYVPGTANWSIELGMNATTNTVTSVNKSLTNGGPGPTTTPLIEDQWVKVRIEIDLDNDTFNLYYGSTALVTNGQWSFNASNSLGTARIQAIDLYSTAVGFRWDDVTLMPVNTGGCYANCDESTTEPVLNVADFSCFLTKFAAGAAYANCDASTQEPVLNVADFSCFLTKFAAGCP